MKNCLKCKIPVAKYENYCPVCGQCFRDYDFSAHTMPAETGVVRIPPKYHKGTWHKVGKAFKLLNLRLIPIVIICIIYSVLAIIRDHGFDLEEIIEKAKRKEQQKELVEEYRKQIGKESGSFVDILKEADNERTAEEQAEYDKKVEEQAEKLAISITGEDRETREKREKREKEAGPLRFIVEFFMELCLCSVFLIAIPASRGSNSGFRNFTALVLLPSLAGVVLVRTLGMNFYYIFQSFYEIPFFGVILNLIFACTLAVTYYLVNIRLLFSFPLAYDRRLGVMDAIRSSWRITRKKNIAILLLWGKSLLLLQILSKFTFFFDIYDLTQEFFSSVSLNIAAIDNFGRVILTFAESFIQSLIIVLTFCLFTVFYRDIGGLDHRRPLP